MHASSNMLFPFLCILVASRTFVTGSQVPFRNSERARSEGSLILDDDFAAWIKETGKSWGMKGMSIAVTRKNAQGDGWTTETKGYGVADKWGNPADDETLYSIGSNSKLFTSLAVGTLTANDSVPLEWDTKIKDILPHHVWALQDKIAEDHASLVDILSHRTGLPRHDLSYTRGDQMESLISKLRFLRPSTEFREKWQYNNQMYTLASYIISQVAATPFAEYVTRNIISPLGLSSTTYNVSLADTSGKLAEGFVNTGIDEERGEGRGRWRFRPIPYWDLGGRGDGFVAGPGGVISNAKDMATWLQALLLSGRSPKTGDVVIPASVVERVSQGLMIVTPVAPFPELSPFVYGMGQMRYTYQGHELVEHNGGTIGHYSVVSRAPHDGLGVAILTNWDYGAIFMEVVKYRVLERALALKEVDWNERLHAKVTANTTQKVPESPAKSSFLSYYDLAGIYFNPAYGTLTFCAYPPPKPPRRSSKDCDTLISEAPSLLHPLLNDSVPSLIAAWPKFWSTHILLQHASGDQFTGIPAHTFPAPFPNASSDNDDSRPFAIGATGTWQTQFVLGRNAVDVEGMAWKGVWGPGLGVESPKEEGREGAEVWFDHVA